MPGLDLLGSCYCFSQAPEESDLLRLFSMITVIITKLNTAHITDIKSSQWNDTDTKTNTISIVYCLLLTDMRHQF